MGADVAVTAAATSVRRVTTGSAWALSEPALRSLASAGATLRERLSGGFEPHPGTRACVDARWQQWCDLSGGEDRLSSRLTNEGLDPQRVRSVLGPGTFTGSLPSWARELQVLLVAAGAVDSTRAAAGVSHPFHRMLAPLARAARRRLEPLLPPSADIRASALDDLEHHLRWTLFSISRPVLELEVEARATFAEMSWEALRGVEPGGGARRLKQLEREMRRGGLVERCMALPAWARLVGVVCCQWRRAALELAQRVAGDREAIGARFFKARAVGAVIQLRPGLSDRHSEGRTVTGIQFEDGGSIVYKPRDLAMEAGLADVLEWLAPRVTTPLPHVPMMLCRRGYGYMAHVDSRACVDATQIEAYYVRAGALLAILYALRGADVHCENLIAAGPYPTVIDAEVLLMPHHRARAPIVNAQEKARLRLNASVAATGLLPRWRIFTTGSAFDTAALGASADQPGRMVRVGWMVSDRLGIARQPNETAAQAGPNVARLGDLPIAADGHLAEIARGFRDLCASLINLQSELIDPAGPLSALCAAGARYLIRATERYGAILERSVRADVLVDGATRSLAIDAGLAQHADGLEVPPRAWAAEREALEDFDVPRFTLDPERPLFISPPDVPATAIVVPGSKAVRDRIATLDATQVAEELYILRASFHGRVGPASPHVLAAPRLNPLASGPPLDKIAALRWAARIASELQSQAIRGDDGSVTWLVPRLEHASEGYNLVPMGAALYSGLTGPALFFAALYRVSGDDEARRTAMAAVRTAIELVDHSHAGMGPGAATGLGSVAYATIVAGLLLDEPEFFDHARVCAHLLMNIRRRDGDFDVSAGPGGAIVALLAVHARVGGDALIAGAEAFAERLIGDDGDRPACVTDAGTGLAHGAAGIAFALARLHAVSGRERWRRAAQALLRYERDVFDPVAGNWPDLRPARKAHGPGFMMGWCAGAPGIALARLDCCHVDHHADADLAVGIAATLAAPAGARDHVCCGNMGRVEILFELGRRLNRPDLVAAAVERAGQLVARAERTGTFTLVSDPAIQIAHPGFHQGLSGIGYALLRLAEPAALPCVLTWS